jgi:hypothetical protein
MAKASTNLYPTYIVSDASGRDFVRCVDRAMAEKHASDRAGNVRLEERNLAAEAKLSDERRAEIDAIYAAGC